MAAVYLTQNWKRRPYLQQAASSQQPGAACCHVCATSQYSRCSFPGLSIPAFTCHLFVSGTLSPDQSAGSLLIGVHWPSQCHAIRDTHSRVSLKAAPLLQVAGSILVAHVQSITKQTFAIATSKAARTQCSSFLTHAWKGGAFWAAQHKICSQRQLANLTRP